MISLFVHSSSNKLLVSGRRPFFDYQLLKPQDNVDGRNGSILLLFDKSAIAEDPTAPPASAKTTTATEKSRKKSIAGVLIVENDVKNPLQSRLQSQSQGSAESKPPAVASQEGARAVHYLPG